MIVILFTSWNCKMNTGTLTVYSGLKKSRDPGAQNQSQRSIYGLL